MYKVDSKVRELITYLNDNYFKRKNQEKEDKYLYQHQKEYLYFNEYFRDKLFPYLYEIETYTITWKVVDNCINFYVVIGDNEGQIFLTLDFRANNTLQYGFYKKNMAKRHINNLKKDIDYKITTYNNSNDWYFIYVTNLDFTNNIKKYIFNSYEEMIRHLKEKSKKINAKSTKHLKKSTNDSDVKEDINEFNDEISKLRSINEVEKDRLVKGRIGQSKFKKFLLESIGECQVCGLKNERFLIASHIIPWSKCLDEDKLYPYNGLLLCPNHDALFDKGFITFDSDTGKIKISNFINEDTKTLLNINEDIFIDIDEKHKKYLEWHNKKIFRGNYL